MDAARLLIPAIRAGPTGNFVDAWPEIQTSLDRGVGGFIVFGGDIDAVRLLVGRIRGAVPHPLLIGSDLERGAGQQFSGATSLPPAAAIASLEDPEITRRAAYVTASEAAAIGINWIFAPIADLDVEPRNPIMGTRAFGSDPNIVAEHVTAWIGGCHDAGVTACAKHFPGHGRTTGDSHLERTRVAAHRAILNLDLIPFRAAIYANVGSMMTAHVGYPAFDPSGEVATLSTPILRDLLRRTLEYDGLIVSDALGMAGLSKGAGEGIAAVRALTAGCDLLLYPEIEEDVLEALAHAVSDGSLTSSRIAESIERLDTALARLDDGSASDFDFEGNHEWARGVALHSIFIVRGNPVAVSGNLFVEIDDDRGGPHPPPARDTFPRILRELGRVTIGAEGGSPLIAVYADPRAWKGRSGLSEAAALQIAAACERSPEVSIVIFGHPRLADEMPLARHVLCAWGGEPVMQEAAARWLSAAPAESRDGVT